MTFDSSYYQIKMLADILGYISWGVASYLFYRYLFSKYPALKNPLKKQENLDYLLTIVSGAFFCGILFSTLDNFLANPSWEIWLTKSIAASIFWATISSEGYKYLNKKKFNTWVIFVPWLVIWMIVWRIGAFMIGLRDHTHGIETNLSWGVNYGDWIFRHPLQLYEITVLTIFFVFFCLLLQYKRKYVLENGFFLFTLIYFSYRFFVWFVSPYSHFWLGMNTYQVISIVMIIYSIYKLKKKWIPS